MLLIAILFAGFYVDVDLILSTYHFSAFCV